MSIYNDGAKRQIMKMIVYPLNIFNTNNKNVKQTEISANRNKSKFRFFSLLPLLQTIQDTIARGLISEAYFTNIKFSYARSQQTNYIYNCCYRLATKPRNIVIFNLPMYLILKKKATPSLQKRIKYD